MGKEDEKYARTENKRTRKILGDQLKISGQDLWSHDLFSWFYKTENPSFTEAIEFFVKIPFTDIDHENCVGEKWR